MFHLYDEEASHITDLIDAIPCRTSPKDREIGSVHSTSSIASPKSRAANFSRETPAHFL